jgi:hypothetical protein
LFPPVGARLFVIIGLIEVPTDPIDTSNALKSLKIRFESSTVVLKNVPTFGVAVEATVVAVEVEVLDRY